jgi:predicted O-methyltransferase YrrM
MTKEKRPQVDSVGHQNKIVSSGNDAPNNRPVGRFIILDSIQDLNAYFNFEASYTIFENDLGTVNHPCDVNQRKYRDAEVLSAIAANIPAGKMLDIGTHFGRSAARMAVNSPQSTIYTVNIHPDDAHNAGMLVTDILSEEQIGSFYRARNIQNIQQLYANTKFWEIPSEISDLSLVYVDGCHDTDFVISDTKLVFDRVKRGGFILWHDFTPIYRENFSWIDAAMRGVEQLIVEGLVKGFILNVRNSWIGIWQKT